MSKRSEEARDAAVECCKALRKWVTKQAFERTEDDFSNEVYPYLQRWMKKETNQCYDDPKPIRARKMVIQPVLEELKQPKASKTCGRRCVAILAEISLDEVIEQLGYKVT